MQFEVSTQGHTDIINITDPVAAALTQSDVAEGVVHVFVQGSTAAVTTMEFEEGLQQDFRDVLENIAPENFDYKHHAKWGDRNGAAHVRSTMVGTDVQIPFSDGTLDLGRWQRLVLIDFDEKPRTRTVIVKIIST